MTKNDLEKENKFLKLQLKVISELLKDSYKMDEIELFESIGRVKHVTECHERQFKSIKEHDLPYNFYNENMSI